MLYIILHHCILLHIIKTSRKPVLQDILLMINKLNYTKSIVLNTNKNLV